MKRMKISISDRLLARHPGLNLRAFTVTDLSRAATRLASSPTRFDLIADALSKSGLDTQNLANDGRIKGWREAIAACGLKPSTFKSSAEQLAKRVLSGSGVSTPLPVVTAYCGVSARHLAPLGGYDMSRLPGEMVELRLAVPGTDTFQPLGGRAEDMPLSDKVAVYAAASQVICYAYNHRDSRETCLTSSTEDALFVGEATEAAHLLPLEAAMDELSKLLESLGASVGPVIGCNAKCSSNEVPVPSLA